jgi:undecaprenyl-diphosphatase
MEVIDAAILGIVQGLTEFLPVSSSGHLELGKAILGDQSVPEESLLFTVVLHFATALSTVIVFRKDVIAILGDVFRFRESENTRLALKIILSMIPAAAIGVLFSDEMESLFDGNVILVGFMLIVTGLLLFLAGRAKRTDKDVGWIDAVIIGVSQAIAILPGVSRSGATISTSVLLGNDRAKAARFSFLMVVPLIFGKIAKDLLDGGLEVQSSSTVPMLVGFVAAFVTGLLACTWMIKLVRKAKLHYFSYYCFAVGLAAIFIGYFS